MNETSTFRRLAATLTIGSFSVAALMGILALLGAGDFGDNEARVLLTTLVVGCTSICVLCYLATAGTRWVPVGALGGLVVLLPLATSLVLVWRDWDGDQEGLLKSFGVGVVLAVTLAQTCLLLALAGTRRSLALVLWATVAMSGLVAALVCGVITEAIDGDIWQFLGIVAILDVLGTLVTIALAKFSDREVAAGSPSEPRPQTGLSSEQLARLDLRARETGRSTDDLIAEAVDAYFATEPNLNAQTATGTGV